MHVCMCVRTRNHTDITERRRLLLLILQQYFFWYCILRTLSEGQITMNCEVYGPGTSSDVLWIEDISRIRAESRNSNSTLARLTNRLFQSTHRRTCFLRPGHYTGVHKKAEQKMQNRAEKNLNQPARMAYVTWKHIDMSSHGGMVSKSQFIWKKIWWSMNSQNNRNRWNYNILMYIQFL